MTTGDEPTGPATTRREGTDMGRVARSIVEIDGTCALGLSAERPVAGLTIRKIKAVSESAQRPFSGPSRQLGLRFMRDSVDLRNGPT